MLPLRALANKGLRKLVGIQCRRVYPERQAIIEAKKRFADRELVACEIGVFFGEHALETFRHLNIKRLYLIDPYVKFMSPDDPSHSLFSKARLSAHKRLQPFADRVVWVEKFSDDAVGDIKEPLDFAYIDGVHYSPTVDNDIRNYYALVKPGGIISGHDYTWLGFPDVVRAVHDFIKRENKELIFGREEDWVVFK